MYLTVPIRKTESTAREEQGTLSISSIHDGIRPFPAGLPNPVVFWLKPNLFGCEKYSSVGYWTALNLEAQIKLICTL